MTLSLALGLHEAFACGMRESFEPDIIIEEMGAIHWGLMGRGQWMSTSLDIMLGRGVKSQ